jgi:hypothetical protein
MEQIKMRSCQSLDALVGEQLPLYVIPVGTVEVPIAHQAFVSWSSTGGTCSLPRFEKPSLQLHGLLSTGDWTSRQLRQTVGWG